MTTYRVHHIRFFDYKPKAIQCLAYSKNLHKLALSRSDGSLEIWSLLDFWYQERVIPSSADKSVEAVIWKDNRLFTAGLDGEVVEYDLVKLQSMHSAFSHAGPIWCLTKNAEGTKLAAGTEQGCVVLFDIDMDNLQYLRAFDKQEGRILSIAWHDGENVIVTGGVDNIRLWSVTSGHAVQRLSIGRSEAKKETIVWCVAVTSDMTVISGDSRGKTCFWNGKMGVLLKSYQCHKADVLTLCLQNDDTVFAAGADPSIVQFKKLSTGSHQNAGNWVKAVTCSGHTHDVRAMVSEDNLLISGGVDTNLVFHTFFPNCTQPKTVKVPGIPHRSLVHVAKNANLILLQYPTCIEIWKLGSTNSKSDVSGKILPVESKPVKLVQLNAKMGESVVCSTISSDGSLLAYSDERSLRLYSLNVKMHDFEPVVTLTRIKRVDTEVIAAHVMAFTKDNKLITATCTAGIQVIEVKDAGGEREANVLHTIEPVKNADAIHLLSVSPDGNHVAVADLNRCVRVYDILTTKLCNIPTHSTQMSAMTFSADSFKLCAAYCDYSVCEYVITTKHEVNMACLSQWGRQNRQVMEKSMESNRQKISQIIYNLSDPDIYFLQDGFTFYVLHKIQVQSNKQNKVNRKRSKSGTESYVKSCSRYQHVLHVESLKDDWLVVVELTPVAITESLPATLRQKKFGT